MEGYTEEQKRTIAVWAGEASKEWWLRLDDSGRNQISQMEAHQIFTLGWMACRAKDATKS